MVTCDSNATEYMQCEGADVMKAMVIGAGRIHARELSSRGGGVGGLIDAQEARSWWPADNHSAMWNHLLKCITGEAEPVATLHHAAGAVADAWRCYEAAGVSR